MAYRLACEMSEKIAGVATFGGFMAQKDFDSENCAGKKINHQK